MGAAVSPDIKKHLASEPFAPSVKGMSSPSSPARLSFDYPSRPSELLSSRDRNQREVYEATIMWVDSWLASNSKRRRRAQDVMLFAHEDCAFCAQHAHGASGSGEVSVATAWACVVQSIPLHYVVSAIDCGDTAKSKPGGGPPRTWGALRKVLVTIRQTACHLLKILMLSFDGEQ
ncbi:hypothetical protein BDZ89DRAFT_1159823 [Hymenopellis radicata]|nr:hypothetical protein BDZ89DRAFT_1159823 [Hymenopellis radicata]